MKTVFKGFVIAAVILLSFGPLPTYALDVKTHEAMIEYISNQMINGFSLDNYLMNQLGFQEGVAEFLKFKESKPISKWLSQGGITEDKPPGLNIPYRRSTNHFHDPISNQGFGGFIFGLFFKGRNKRSQA
jgi:hypothetical protein